MISISNNPSVSPGFHSGAFFYLFLSFLLTLREPRVIVKSDVDDEWEIAAPLDSYGEQAENIYYHITDRAFQLTNEHPDSYDRELTEDEIRDIARSY